MRFLWNHLVATDVLSAQPVAPQLDCAHDHIKSIYTPTSVSVQVLTTVSIMYHNSCSASHEVAQSAS